jgi:hypothetical protein
MKAMMKYFLGALAALTLAAPTLAAPIAAQAQDVPSYASGAQPADGEENIHGRVASFDGAYTMTVRDERGFIDNIQLHQGTIINPTGLTLAPGMVVSVIGYNSGPYLSANEIDTPYTIDGGVPWYAGHPWYFYGPTIALGFYFGSGGWWHPNWFYGGYHWYGGVRVYNNFSYRNVYHTTYGGYNYHGTSWNGRSVVAPRSAGGYYAHPSGNVSHGGGGGGSHGGGGGGSHH